MFERGYKRVRDRVRDKPKAYRSCLNCNYYYQAKGDTEDCCQNGEVLQYDMVIEDTLVYCLRWECNKPNSSIRKVKSHVK